MSTLNEHGIVSSYDEVLRFRKSAAKYVCEHSEEYDIVLGLARCIGPICSSYSLLIVVVPLMLWPYNSHSI